MSVSVLEEALQSLASLAPQTSAASLTPASDPAVRRGAPLTIVLDETVDAPETAQSLALIEQGLAGLSLAPGVAHHVMALLECAVAHHEAADPAGLGPQAYRPVVVPAGPELASDESLLAAVEAARVVSAFADSVATMAVRSLAERVGRELLGTRGVADPQELSATARERWRAQTKSVLAHELRVMNGWGVQACHDRVGFATAPVSVSRVCQEAMDRGVADWDHVGQWWTACRRLPVDDAAQVAGAVFGERLDHARTQGAGAGRWPNWKEHQLALAREVARAHGAPDTEQQARQTRAEAMKARSVWVDLYDDGTGVLSVHGPVTGIVAAFSRLDKAARLARKAGDPRTLDQLRTDIALGLMVNGVSALPPGIKHLPASSDPPAGPGSASSDPHAGRGLDSASSGPPAGSGSASPVSPGPTSSELPDDPTALAEIDATVHRILAGLPTTSVELVVPISALVPGGEAPLSPGAQPVGALADGGFVTAAHARELVCAPGTVFHRLVTDPLDGRLIERSINRYRPDAAMIAQIRALDRTCRGPGSLVPADRCDLDHEVPHGSGGPTSESNLNPKSRTIHNLKTLGLWQSAMDASRVVTWRTLLGRVYSTRSHDYRHYHHRPTVNSASGGASDASADPLAAALVATTDSDLRNRVVYAALSSRDGRHAWLSGYDDCASTDDDWHDLPVRTFHRVGKVRRRGPRPGDPTVPELVSPHGATDATPRGATNTAPAAPDFGAIPPF